MEAKKKTIRIKATLSVVIFIIATFFNWKQIPIQDNYVDLVKWVVLGFLGGFSVKTVTQSFLNRNSGGN